MEMTGIERMSQRRACQGDREVPMNRQSLTRRQFASRVGLLAGAFGVTALLQACGSSADSRQVQDDEPVVKMTDEMRFEPDLLTIEAGQSITWRNTGTMVHTITTDPAKAQRLEHVSLPEGATGWDSGLLRAGESWRHTFEVPGEYTYFCIPHESAGMVGRIVVKG
jgi:plastocyanin